MSLGYKLKNLWYDFRNLFIYNLRGRITRGFDLRETWDLDSTISKFVYPRLKYFVETRPQGHPGVLMNDEFIDEHKLEPYMVGTTDEELYASWIVILEKILKTFEDLQSVNGEKLSYEERREGLRLFAIFYENLWD